MSMKEKMPITSTTPVPAPSAAIAAEAHEKGPSVTDDVVIHFIREIAPVDHSVDEVRMRGIDARVDHRDDHTSAGESGSPRDRRADLQVLALTLGTPEGVKQRAQEFTLAIDSGAIPTAQSALKLPEAKAPPQPEMPGLPEMPQ